MNHKELRIGNLVKHNDSIIEVESIIEHTYYGGNGWYINQPFFDDEIAGIRVKLLEGIVLNADILKKVGFEKGDGLIEQRIYITGANKGEFDGADWYKMKGVFIEVFVKGKAFYAILSYSGDDYGDSYESKQIKYLHELQNLIFALEGKELTFDKEQTTKQ